MPGLNQEEREALAAALEAPGVVAKQNRAAPPGARRASTRALRRLQRFGLVEFREASQSFVATQAGRQAVPCPACRGFGHFGADGRPTMDRSKPACHRCDGSRRW